MSIIITLAEEIKTQLNSNAFILSLMAIRSYRPVFDLKDMKELHVSVVPKTQLRNLISRASVEKIIEVDVAIQQKITDIAESDTLIQLAEEISEFFHKKTLLGVYFCFQSQINPIFDPIHLESFNQLTSLVTLTYKVF